jgi:hypothetical protein
MRLESRSSTPGMRPDFDPERAFDFAEGHQRQNG